MELMFADFLHTWNAGSSMEIVTVVKVGNYDGHGPWLNVFGGPHSPVLEGRQGPTAINIQRRNQTSEAIRFIRDPASPTAAERTRAASMMNRQGMVPTPQSFLRIPNPEPSCAPLLPRPGIDLDFLPRSPRLKKFGLESALRWVMNSKRPITWE